MKRLASALAATALLWSGAAAAQDRVFMNTKTLAAWCGGAADPDPAMAFALERACLGELRGFFLTARFYAGQGGAAPPFCAPLDVTVEVVREVFLDWAAAHPGLLHQSEILSLHQAMAAGFPCGPSGRQVR
ncbi:MAG: Rap1a/Tai family immunity protein [Sneathiellaceae bacterium]